MRRLLTLLTVCLLSLPLVAQELYISEYLEGSSNNKSIEIYNPTSGTVNLATGAYNIQMFFNGSSTAGLTINLSGSVAAGDVYVLSHASAGPAILAQTDQTNGAGWFNGDDAVVLRKGTTVLDVIGQIGFDPGSEWGIGLTSTMDNAIRRKMSVTGGDPNGSDPFDPSIEWNGFLGTIFTDIGTYGGTPPPPPVSVREIYEIQGSGNASPFAGQTVETRDNIVTAVAPDGFFIQTPDGRADASSSTSNGIYVFTSSAPTVAVGDMVDVKGPVVEYFNFTEFSGAITVTKDASNMPLPAYFEIVPGFTAFETVEGMLVRLNGGIATAGTDGYGETVAVAGSTRPFRQPGIDGGDYTGFFDIDPTEMGAAAPFVVGGATIELAEGALAFDFGAYSIWATAFEFTNPEFPRGARARNDGEMTIAAQNMFRLFDDRDDPSLPNGDEDILTTANYQARLARISAHVRENLGSPDVLAVSEVENLLALEDLAARLNADDSLLSYTAYLIEGNDIGGIDVGFLVNSTVAVDSIEQLGADDTWIDPNTGNPDPLNDRPALLLRGSYVANGAAFPIGVVAVHQRSLIGVETSARTRAKREAQSHNLVGYLNTIQSETPGIRLVVTGDFNAFEFNDGYVDVMGIITSGANLTNQVLGIAADSRYSYSHDGLVQVLDHSLTSSSLNPSVRGAEFIHVNVDAPASYLPVSDHDGIVLFVMTDHDGDGYADDTDSCPTGDASATVVLGGCDTGVANIVFAGGCSLTDQITAIHATAKNHGQYVSAVSKLLNDLMKAGTLTGAQKGAIESCAAQWN